MDSAAGNAAIDRRGKDPVGGNPAMMIPYIHTYMHTYYIYIHTYLHVLLIHKFILNIIHSEFIYTYIVHKYIHS